VERAFLRGGLTVSKMRHNLSDESLRAATVLGTWASHPEIIPRDEITAIFKAKAERPKGKSGEEDDDVVLVE
jgi:hypothetical protein